MIASNIKIDLHIHSKMSEYKENREIVKNSNIENIDLLIQKLEEHDITMFSITDHNKFDYALYKAFKEKIKQSNKVKKILPGVEFDVKFEDDKDKCHIIAIFDDAHIEKLELINKKIEKFQNPITKDTFYSINEFESILKDIGLSVVLIAHQKKDINNSKNDNSKSLSDSTKKPLEIIKSGFIDSLEFTSSKHEGILKNALHRDDIYDMCIITGSDCHEWEAYPKHNSINGCNVERFTTIKLLPTFKGLVMAITSPKTRINVPNNSNKNYIKSISLENNIYNKLSKGLNVIIGDNGSGKSLLANLIANKINVDEKIERFYQMSKIINDFKLEKNNDSKTNANIKYIRQSSIQKKLNEGKLFDENDYNEIFTLETFEKEIKNFYNKLINFIETNIDKQNCINNLSKNEIQISANRDSSKFYHLNFNDNLSNIDVIEEIRSIKLKEIIESLNVELSNDFYNDFNKEIEIIQDNLKNIINNIDKKIRKKKAQAYSINIIKSKMSAMAIELKEKSTTIESEQLDYKKQKTDFKNKIIECIKTNLEENNFPNFPDKIKGTSTKNSDGFIFKQIAQYHDKNLKQEFYECCFKKENANDESIMSIKSKEDFLNCFKGLSYDDRKFEKNTKVQKFIKKYLKIEKFILDASNESKLGGTPGESSLIFYKCIFSSKKNDYDIIIIDQLEDDINPSRLKNELFSYIQNCRYDKQIFIVTHNPLLVVNIDADNIIYIEKDNNYRIKSGCLEYKCDDYSIIDIVKEKLDGGIESIKRRMKVYGNN